MAEVTTLDKSGQGHNPASPASSTEPVDEEEEDHTTRPSKDSPWSKSSSPSQQVPRASAPLQKRRRVTRACDECRRKKIKCDGRQACSHCEIYGYECTYDQPSNRRRNPAPQYIENLEIRLQRAEGLIRTYLPQIDLNDPSIDNAILHPPRHGGTPQTSSLQGLAAKPPAPPPEADQDGQLRSMIESTGQLDLDEDGQWDFHGGSSGMVFMSRMRQQFGGLLGLDKSTPLLTRLPRPYPGSASAFDSPKSSVDSPFDSSLPHVVELPAKDVARALVVDTLGRACSLLRFVHEPSFMEMFNKIYDTPVEGFGNDENKFLPLLYLVLAVGCMFHTDPTDDPKLPMRNTYRAGIDSGLKYFRAARSLMDITDCRDMVSLQAILFMIMFLQSTANLSTCYSYIGIALRSALRMGLHRNLAFNFNPIERETRRRVFWVIRQMDTYVSALLGFPDMLSLDDVDQEYPLEIDDEYVTKDAILPMPRDKLSIYAASNAHSRLMVVLAKVIKNIYPVKGVGQSVQDSPGACYVVSHAKIKEIESELIAWFEKLPMALRPDGETNEDIVRVQQLLRLAYAHVQMMLYRPFLHYVSQKSNQGKMADKRSYACAAACVSVSRNIIHITTELKKRGLLVGAYWFTMYTTFFAIISLVYYVLENPRDPGSQQILADANDGYDALKGFAQRSQAADRCATALQSLFERLPEKLKHDPAPVPKKKRNAPSLSSSAPSQAAPVPIRRQNNFNQEPKMGISRATTFPLQAQSEFIPTTQPSRSSVDGPRFQAPTLSNPNLRQSFNDYASPVASGVGTPDSAGSQNMMPQQFSHSQSLGVSGTLPDLNAMMFPSEDPFAYPNQPMMEFDNFKREPMDMMSGSPAPQIYMQSSNSGSQSLYDGLEGQLFGALPPYMSQGQPEFDLRSQLGGMNEAMNTMNAPQVVFQNGMTGNFDGLFSGGEMEDWSNMMPNQRFRPQ